MCRCSTSNQYVNTCMQCSGDSHKCSDPQLLAQQSSSVLESLNMQDSFAAMSFHAVSLLSLLHYIQLLLSCFSYCLNHNLSLLIVFFSFATTSSFLSSLFSFTTCFFLATFFFLRLYVQGSRNNTLHALYYPYMHYIIPASSNWGKPERAPHQRIERWVFHIYIYICRTSFRKYKLTVLTRNIAHAEFKCGRNIEKNTWSK